MVSPNDRSILRSLAARVREIADMPEMQQRKELWYDHNALRPRRPLVLCFPEGAWGELLPRSVCQCEDPLLRWWEWDLRHRIYWWEHLRDDNTVEPYLNIGWDVAVGNFGVEVPYTHGENRGSFVWDAPIKDLDRDFAKLKFRSLSVSRDETARKLRLAGDILGDLLTPRLRATYWWTCGLTIEAIRLVGLEQLMLYMCDNPQGIHRLMAFLRDEQLHLVKWYEAEGLLTPMNGNDYTGSGGVGYSRQLPGSEVSKPGEIKLSHMWGFAESQETVGISPAMFEEFILPYQLPLLDLFGLNCYGCCEPVHTRLAGILRIPRLRRVSVSPWADQRIMAEELGRKCIFSRKPNPTMICAMFDEQIIRKDLRETLDTAGGGVLEIVMKDTHTVQNEPRRMDRWVAIAREEIEAYIGRRRGGR